MRRLFEPLGYQVSTEHHPLDEKFPEWGEGSYYTVEIAKDVTLQDLLTHLYVLIPVLDADKNVRSLAANVLEAFDWPFFTVDQAKISYRYEPARL